MGSDARCRTELLADAPAEADAFGSHGRVARSIAEVVETERGGRSIGLEGAWGTGKSTIVGLAAKNLAEVRDGEHRTVVFDMWAHQDDPLRRTFLENLIIRAQEFNWVNQKKWNERLAELAQRRREETTRVVPRLTGAGFMFGLTLLFIPIGAALISAGATSSASSTTSTSGTLAMVLLIAGFIAALAPMIFGAAASLIRHAVRKLRGIGGAEEGGLIEFPALITGQASTESRTVVTQSPDPTSVEFETIFRELLDDALAKKNRKLLLVVDNLDRVQPADALAIWSTLQTFVGHSDYPQSSWIDRLWVLIPYDGNAILRLWDWPNDRAGESVDAELGASFLDKTFQLRFTVPPLLLSNWRGFLRDALQRALPDHQERDFHDVYRAFAIKGGLEKSAPSPRDLKIFVNQIGALHRARQDEFPLSHLACYALLQKDRVNVHDALLSDGDLAFAARIIGEEWREVIGAIHYGVPTAEARQLLLRGPIEVALSNGDGDTISELLSAHPTAFWSVLEDCVPAGSQNWYQLSPSELASAAIALRDSHVLDETNDLPETIAIKSSIRTAATKVQAWAPFNAATTEGIVAVVQLVGDQAEIVPALLAGASNAPVEFPDGAQQEQDLSVSPNIWMASALDLIKGLAALGFDEHMNGGIRVPLSAQQWFDVASDAARSCPDGKLLRFFDVPAIQEIDQLLDERLAINELDGNTFDAVDTAMRTRSRTHMTNTARQLLSQLQSGESFEAAHIARMLKALRNFQAEGLVSQDQYDGFASSGHYLHHLYSAAAESHGQATAECMFGYLKAVPDAREPDHVGNSSPGYQRFTQILEGTQGLEGAVEHFTLLAKETLPLEAVFEMACAETPIDPFFAEVLRTILVSNDVSKPTELVIDKWLVVKEVLASGDEVSQSFEKFLAGLTGIDELIDGIRSRDFDAGDGGLYLAVVRTTRNPSFETWCASGLSSMNQEAWSNAIMSRGELIDLAVELRQRGSSVNPGVGYFDALVEYINSIASSAQSVNPNVNQRDLLELLNPSHRELLPRRAYEFLAASGGGASGEFFTLLDGMLSDRKLLAGEPRFIDQVCRPILDNGNEPGIEWLSNVAHEFPELLTRNNDRAAADDFLERVKQRAADTPEDDAKFPHLRKLASALSIELVDTEAFERSSESSQDAPGSTAINP